MEFTINGIGIIEVSKNGKITVEDKDVTEIITKKFGCTDENYFVQKAGVIKMQFTIYDEGVTVDE